ncbi:unnamed protein product [Caenorhabditis auriculariae]|uniref:G protein-coupled receptor n=1 Tax=Caenorhabditis auriculariae TaxID=2777116 RepID=A0A8S1HGK0_9PELO|nr:unnamed protein product [Caenorhabditis auriculariae]
MKQAGGFIEWSPRVFVTLSLIFNPLWIYLLHSTKSVLFGRYRHLLTSFAVFDIIYSVIDLVAPLSHIQREAALCGVLRDDVIPQDSPYSFTFLVLRCSFIGLTFGILEIHFFYRYLALCKPHLLFVFIKPLYIVCWVLFFLYHGATWGSLYLLLGMQDETREYLQDEFLKEFGTEMFGNGFVCVHFNITRTLKEYMSSLAVKKMHRQLFHTLLIQASIPMFVSFLPCGISWFATSMSIRLRTFNDYYSLPMLSAFPALDPIAIIYFLPQYRQRLCPAWFRKILKIEPLSKAGSNRT